MGEGAPGGLLELAVDTLVTSNRMSVGCIWGVQAGDGH